MSAGKQDKVSGVFSAKGQPQDISRKTGRPAAFSYPYGGMYWLPISRNLRFVSLLTATR